jgi:hypothetical protein
MWTRPPLSSDLPPLCAGMRELDITEIYALRTHRDPHRLAGEIWRALPHAIEAFVAGVDGEPSAIAFAAVWPRSADGALGEAAMFASESFPRIAASFVRHIRKTLIPSSIARGVRRVECRAWEHHPMSHRLVLACGAVREARLNDVGPDGMAYVQFAWTKTDLEKNR